MEIKQNQCIFLGHWIDATEMLDTDLQDRIISNYVYYEIYGYHRYADEPIIVAITNLWDAEIKNYFKEEIINDI